MKPEGRRMNEREKLADEKSDTKNDNQKHAAKSNSHGNGIREQRGWGGKEVLNKRWVNIF